MAPRPTATRPAWALCFLSVALALASVVLAAVNGEGPAELVADHRAVGILTTPVVVEGLSLGVFNFTRQYASLASGSPRGSPRCPVGR